MLLVAREEDCASRVVVDCGARRNGTRSTEMRERVQQREPGLAAAETPAPLHEDDVVDIALVEIDEAKTLPRQPPRNASNHHELLSNRGPRMAQG